MASRERMSPWMMWRFGYWDEREASLEAVRASTVTVWPAARQFFRMERPVPPVAPKMATVRLVGAVVGAEEDMFALMSLYDMDYGWLR